MLKTFTVFALVATGIIVASYFVVRHPATESDSLSSSAAIGDLPSPKMIAHSVPDFIPATHEPEANEDAPEITDPTGAPPPPPPRLVVPALAPDPRLDALLAAAHTVKAVYRIMADEVCQCRGLPCVMNLNRASQAALARATGDDKNLPPSEVMQPYLDCVARAVQ